VASHADVALGTLYRRFRSKEDLLVAALEMETAQIVKRVRQRPPRGDVPRERVVAFFSSATRGMCRRPNLSRACLKAAASGEAKLAVRVAAYHRVIEELVVGALRGRFYDSAASDEVAATEEELGLARVFSQLWFACLVGWAGGLYDERSVIEQMEGFGWIIFRERVDL
jgi:AcrR family transcriptional regulator